MKKIILIVIGLILIGAGLFYWWQNQADVRELNKDLPDGIKVVKSILGEEYRVVNKIDGYNFEIPIEAKSWNKIGSVEYKDLTTDDLGYRSSMKEEIKNKIELEKLLSIKNPNGLSIINVSSLHFDENFNMNQVLEEFKAIFNLPRSGQIIEITPKIDYLTMGNFNVLKLSEVTKNSRDNSEILFPLVYLFNSNNTLYIIPDIFGDEITSQIIIDGQW